MAASMNKLALLAQTVADGICNSVGLLLTSQALQGLLPLPEWLDQLCPVCHESDIVRELTDARRKASKPDDAKDESNR